MKNKDLEQKLITQKKGKKEPKDIMLHETNPFRRLFVYHPNKIIDLGQKTAYNKDMLFKLEDKYLHKNFEHFNEYYEKRKEYYGDDFYHMAIRYPLNEFYVSLGFQIVK